MQLAYYIPRFAPEVLLDPKDPRALPPSRFSLVAPNPLSPGEQTVLVVESDGEERWVRPGVCDINPDAYELSGPADTEQLRCAFAVAAETFAPLLKNPSDVLPKLKYHFAGGAELTAPLDVSKEDWLILERLPIWFPEGRKPMEEKLRMADFENAGGVTHGSFGWVKKRAERIRAKGVKL